MRDGGYWQWAHTPSTTIAGDPRITAREHHYHGEQNETSFRLTIEEATILQSYPPYETEQITMNDFTQHRTLDLFAGSGWGVAHQRLGVHEDGVENMPEAIATRELNGMTTAFQDVWEDDNADALDFDTEVASPPCQKFSMAGAGEGRKALSQVLSMIESGWESMDELHERSLKMGDEKIGLVLTPLHYAWKYEPKYIVLEQVPPVLPVWESIANQLREIGYSAWTGLLQAEMYGVPQTRKRAILIARRDGKVAKPPTPTHSRYYSTKPTKLDSGVKKWVSMAEALGWGSSTVMRSNYGSGGDPAARGERSGDQPAPTITSKADRNKVDGRSLSLDEAAELQSFPTFTQNNKLAHASHRKLDQPAPTITAGHDSGNRGFISEQGFVPATVGTIADLQSFPVPFRFAGAKTKQFLQCGNAVPPLLAEAIMTEAWS